MWLKKNIHLDIIVFNAHNMKMIYDQIIESKSEIKKGIFYFSLLLLNYFYFGNTSFYELGLPAIVPLTFELRYLEYACKRKYGIKRLRRHVSFLLLFFLWFIFLKKQIRCVFQLGWMLKYRRIMAHLIKPCLFVKTQKQL